MAAIEAGWQQREIHEAAWAHLNEVESGKRKIIGINHGLLDNAEDSMPVMKINPELAQQQNAKLAKIRNIRNPDSVEKVLQAIRHAAESNDNLFPLVIEALKNECTLGEIMNAMKDVFGTWMAPSGF